MPKRKNRLVTVREPNGRISRAGRETEYPPTQVKRLRDAAVAGMRDPQWGTQLGRLFLAGSISPEMYAAGRWWSEMAIRYQAALGSPLPFPKAISLDIGRGNQSADPDSDAGRKEADRHRRAVATFHEAHAVLMGAGLAAERIIRRLCEDDVAPCGLGELMNARRGLLWVAEFRGLTRDNKSRHVR